MFYAEMFRWLPYNCFCTQNKTLIFPAIKVTVKDDINVGYWSFDKKEVMDIYIFEECP